LIVQRPQIEEEVLSPTRSRIVVEPLEPGFGYTLGNTLRRTLLSRIPGAAITSIQIEGVEHEFTTVPGVVEDVVEIILNLKRVVIRMEGYEEHTLYLSAKGAGEVKAGDLKVPAGVEVMNPDAHIATMSASGRLEMELVVGPGVGYRTADQNKGVSSAIGVIPIDSIFSPVRRVSYRVESTQDLFDTELVIRAERAGYRIVEVPVTVEELRATKSSLVKRVPRTLMGLIRIRRALRREDA